MALLKEENIQDGILHPDYIQEITSDFFEGVIFSKRNICSPAKVCT